MNKPKVAEVKKSLVRHPEQPIPKTVNVVPSAASISSKVVVDSACSSHDSATKVSQYKVAQKTRFNVPEMHSTLKLSKKIDNIVCPRKSKSLSEIDKSKLAVDEKVSRKVNFPLGKPVFKDLIPLSNDGVRVQPSIAVKGPIYQKDKEPVLSDFLNARKEKVYYHKPRSSISYLQDRKMNVPVSDSLRLYKVLQINDSN